MMSLSLSLALCACVQAPPLTPAGPAATRTAPVGIAPDPDTAVISAPDAAIVANNGASLIGKVKAPAPLISDKGAGIVSNNGGGLISDKGMGYRLAALAQVPVAGATVALLDGAGDPVLQDGRPVTATTDAAGNYAFEVALSASNWQLRVALPDSGGHLTAIVPSAGDRRDVTVDLVSTLTTTYILDQYVAGQADPQAVLDKLPPAVEAETRQKAAYALDAGAVPVPDSLATAQIVATVDALREHDKTFDAQMEAVKRLLVVAGLADLGAGQQATDVFFGAIRAAFPTADGLYLQDGEVFWRVTDAGLLERLPVEGEWDGTLSIDDRDRLWRGGGESGKIFRREANGAITEVYAGEPAARGFAPSGGDGYVYVTGASAAGPVELWAVDDGGAAPRRLATFTGQEARVLWYARAMAADAAGRVYFLHADPIPHLYRYDDGGLTDVLAYGGEIGTIQLDARANIRYERGEQVYLRSPDGSERAVPGLTGLSFGDYKGVPPGPDGTEYVLGNPPPGGWGAFRSLYRLEGDRRVLVAGKEQRNESESTDPALLSLKAPRGLVVNGEGDVFVSDASALLRISPQEGVQTAIAAGAVAGYEPARLAAGPGNVVYVQMKQTLASFDDAGPIYRLDGDRLTLLLAPEGEGVIDDWLVAPDGSLYVFESRHEGITAFYGQLRHVTADGQATTLVPESADYFIWYGAGFDATGRLCLEANRKEPGDAVSGKIHLRWDGTALVPAPERPFYPEALDVQGRWVASIEGAQAGERVIKRYDPESGVIDVLVGPGGKLEPEAGSSPNYRFPCFDAAGNLLFLDVGAKQIKRLSADAL